MAKGAKEVLVEGEMPNKNKYGRVLNMMKASLEKFFEYVGSDEELMYFMRINADWNEESFIKMEQLIREVIRDYANDDSYHKKFIIYFMREIPSIIEMLSHFKVCPEDYIQEGYTQESYRNLIAERVERLQKLRKDFIKSL